RGLQRPVKPLPIRGSDQNDQDSLIMSRRLLKTMTECSELLNGLLVLQSCLAKWERSYASNLFCAHGEVRLVPPVQTERRIFHLKQRINLQFLQQRPTQLFG